MTTGEFLASLVPYGKESLGFATDQAHVAPGYHLTEIKSIVVRAMDCGGKASEWGETVLQVLPGPEGDAERMDVAKFLSIYDRAAQALMLDKEAQVRVEYGEVGESAVSYLVSAVSPMNGEVVVKLAAPAVACKGADRSVGNIPLVRTPMHSGERGGEGAVCCAPTSTSGECEVEVRAVADFGLGPDSPAMAVNDSLHDRQTDPRTRKVVA